ncbi:MAG: type II toxin-antitoxin system RelE family toxin [Terrimicrobiaceae bacterium]|jgi:mRNA-degrading endonuclease RelE of RelBE toxin-antitoxin system
MRVRVQQDVIDYLRRLPPQPRHALRVAIKALAMERGDIKSLVDDLEGFHRLRVGSHRVIFEYEMIDGQRTVTCVFAGQRKWIYEVFQSRLHE